jgi:spore coat protein CotH
MGIRLGGLVVLSAFGALGQTVDDFFDDKILHDIRITIHPKDWTALVENFKDNTYYPAIVQWRGSTIENVGIRSKGRTSRRATKPGMRVDCNRFEEQEFLGLKAFLLDNNISDYGVMRERLASILWREMGLPAPRETHTRLFINGQYMGVYTLTEETDKPYLRRWFNEDSGWLYEFVHRNGYRFEYLGDNPDEYVPVLFKPETNELHPEAGVIEEMLRVINQSSDQEFPKAIEEYLDVKQFLTHLAAETYVAEWDGILSDAGVANIYFYRFKAGKRGTVLFKDKDLSFDSTGYEVLKNADRNVLVRRLMAVPEWKEFLYGEIRRAGALAGGEGGLLDTQIGNILNQIRAAVYLDTLKECSTGVCPVNESNAEFERHVEFLRDFAKSRPSEVIRQLGLRQ